MVVPAGCWLRTVGTRTVVIFLYKTTPEFPSRKMLLAGRGWMITRQQFLPTCCLVGARCFTFSDGTRYACRVVHLAFEWFFTILQGWWSRRLIIEHQHDCDEISSSTVRLLWLSYHQCKVHVPFWDKIRWSLFTSLHFTSLYEKWMMGYYLMKVDYL